MKVMGLMSMNGHLRECLLVNKSAQLSPQLSLGFSMNFILIKKYICTMTTKKNLLAGFRQRTSESLLEDIRRNTKRIFTSEQKGFNCDGRNRGEQSIAELCRKYGISDSTYYKCMPCKMEGQILLDTAKVGNFF